VSVEDSRQVWNVIRAGKQKAAQAISLKTRDVIISVYCPFNHAEVRKRKQHGN
jgi:hypothetical protein